MKNYPSIQSLPISFNVTIIGSRPPLIADQTYTLSATSLIIQIGAFEIIPTNFNAGPSSIDAYVYEGS
jgi:hypothetical protein